MLLKHALLASSHVSPPIPGPPLVLDWFVDVAIDNHFVDSSNIGVETGDYQLLFLQNQAANFSTPTIQVPPGVGLTNLFWDRSSSLGFGIWGGFAISDGGPFSVGDGNQASILSMFRLKGVHPTTPVNVTSGMSSGSDATAECSGLTTTVNDALVFRSFVGDASDVTNDTGFPPGHTNYYVRDGQQGSSLLSGGVASFHQATSGLVPSAIFTLDAAMDHKGISIAIAAKNPTP